MEILTILFKMFIYKSSYMHDKTNDSSDFE